MIFRVTSKRLQFAALAVWFAFAIPLLLPPLPAVAAKSSARCAAEFSLLTKKFRYPKELAELKPGVRHTIHNMDKFLRDKLGKELVDHLDDKSVRFTVVRGPGRSIRGLYPGGTKFEEVKNPFGAFNVVKVTLKDGKTEFVLTNVNGESRYLQVLSMLKLGGVSENQIRLAGQMVSYEPMYRKTFEQIGRKPDLVVFGFSNTALQGLVDRPAVRNSRRMLRRNQKYADEKWEKPAHNKHELSKMGVQVIEYKNGMTVWFIDNEYGDRAVDLYQALDDYGAGRIVLLGTAGSLDESHRIGDVVSPAYFLTEDGNKFRSTFDSSIKQRGLSIDVETPTLETKRWLKEQIDEGADLVDVEMVKIAQEALERGDEDMAAYLIISDLLNTKKPTDYTQWTESHRRRVKQDLLPILDHHLNHVGVPDPAEIKDYRIFHFAVDEAN